MEENRVPPIKVLYMNLGTTRLRSRPRNGWQDEVRVDGRIVGGEGWQEKVHYKEEWKKLLRTARNLGTTRLRGRPRNWWQDEVREDGRITGGEGWQEKVHYKEEWKKLLRTARNRRILHMPMERINEWIHKDRRICDIRILQQTSLLHDLSDITTKLISSDRPTGNSHFMDASYWTEDRSNVQCPVGLTVSLRFSPPEIDWFYGGT